MMTTQTQNSNGFNPESHIQLTHQKSNGEKGIQKKCSNVDHDRACGNLRDGARRRLRFPCWFPCWFQLGSPNPEGLVLRCPFPLPAPLLMEYPQGNFINLLSVCRGMNPWLFTQPPQFTLHPDIEVAGDRLVFA